MRTATLSRTTKETSIDVKLNLDGTGKTNISTGVGFFDHMLELFAFHAKFDLDITAKGDLQVDDHHMIEDAGIVIGQAILEALNDKKGINRYATTYVPMDEALARVNLDISGRSFLVYNVDIKRSDINGYATEMTREFLRAVAYNMKATLHVNVEYGFNDHHKVEAIFKALGRALNEATMITSNILPSTKGEL